VERGKVKGERGKRKEERGKRKERRAQISWRSRALNHTEIIRRHKSRHLASFEF
jgi:hypothetical protein